MIGYWISLVNGSSSKFATKIYNIVLNDYLHIGTKYKWLDCIKQILISVGKPDLLNQYSIHNPRATKLKLSKTLHDLFVQDWNVKINASSKGRNYKLFKQDIKLEPFLTFLPRHYYLPLIKFRSANHKLPIETGRWENINHQDRKCNLCMKNDLGDEFHYLLVCPFFDAQRKQLLKRYYFLRPNIIKYKELLNCKNKYILLNLSKFIIIIMKHFS